MPEITADAAGGQNVCAFLDMLAIAEGTSTSQYTRNNGYDVVVGGINSPNTFSDYSTHPCIYVHVNSNGLVSTAAGRYQLLFRYWADYSRSLNLPDFGPLSQDRIAIQQISERQALDDLQSGNIVSAITKCANIWASLPGNDYDQHEDTYSSLIADYVKAGGENTSPSQV
ncbi:Muramidase (phage lambda lysozyme) [Pseudomonas asplenii]|uniref:Muramidase (Phage lambda lysozyme) n=1 Tax=Pseudomonas asplenii TaxID=53407 RepID=A0A1H1VM05_9PSED|nr:glycoside hydrolase family 104 protein [Pseudomonas asplenii]SDS85954.1 Muramidase (phage lambda lysozyme) [Pseudomonas asplenii]